MPVEYFIAKVYKQHRSLCIAIPKAVCIALGLEAGQHMVFTWHRDDGKFRFSKFIPAGAKDGEDNSDSDTGDKGRGT